MNIKRIGFLIVLAVFLGVAVSLVAVRAQSAPQLLSDNELVKKVAADFTQNLKTRDGRMQTMGGEIVPIPQSDAPFAVLHLNGAQYFEGGTLQAWLDIPNNTVVPREVGIGWSAFSMDAKPPDYISSRIGGNLGGQLLEPGKRIPLTSYTFTNEERRGLWGFIAFVYDYNTGLMLAQPVATFTFGGFTEFDSTGYMRLDYVENLGGKLRLHGNFIPTDQGIAMWEGVVIAGRAYPFKRASYNEAIVELGIYPPYGVHDVILVVRVGGNYGYDSTTQPAALKSFLLRL